MVAGKSALKPQFAKEIMEKIKSDKSLRDNLMKSLDVTKEEFQVLLKKDKIETAIKSLMGTF